jgi:hypothetical protein
MAEHSTRCRGVRRVAPADIKSAAWCESRRLRQLIRQQPVGTAEAAVDLSSPFAQWLVLALDQARPAHWESTLTPWYDEVQMTR